MLTLRPIIVAAGLFVATFGVNVLAFADRLDPQLDPITAICFKIKANAGVCQCATHQLRESSTTEDFDQYEAVIIHTLSQTNVPRSQAWQNALLQHARRQGETLKAIESRVLDTSRLHNKAIEDCQ